MKKLSSLFLAVLLLLVALPAPLKAQDLVADSAPRVTIQYPKKTLYIANYWSVYFPAVVYNSSSIRPKVTYTSKDKSIATVDKKGRIRARRVGTTHIIAKTRGAKPITLKVRVVKEERPVDDLYFTNVPKSMNIGTSHRIKTNVFPSDHTGAVRHTVSENVISVDAMGLVRANRVGGATVISSAGGVVESSDIIEVYQSEAVNRTFTNGKSSFIIPYIYYDGIKLIIPLVSMSGIGALKQINGMCVNGMHPRVYCDEEYGFLIRCLSDFGPAIRSISFTFESSSYDGSYISQVPVYIEL